MTADEQLTGCARCRELHGVWAVLREGESEHGTAPSTEISFALHVRKAHPQVHPGPVDDCEWCPRVLAALSAPFAPPGETMHWADGTSLHPSDLHFARHALERMAPVPG
jgi:hypothetical protein